MGHVFILKVVSPVLGFVAYTPRPSSGRVAELLTTRKGDEGDAMLGGRLAGWLAAAVVLVSQPDRHVQLAISKAHEFFIAPNTIWGMAC